MIALLHSGKFWLKLMVIGFISLLTLFLLEVVSLHYLFNREKIYQQFNMMMADTQHHIDFSDHISRSWFPRPTVTLHHVHISSDRHQANELSMDAMKIGISWKTLFGQKLVERWQWQDVQANITRTEDGHWNIEELWQSFQPKNHQWRINRFNIDRATVQIHDGKQTRILSQFNANIKNLSGYDRTLEANGLWQNIAHPPVKWQLQAVNSAVNQWRQVQLNIHTDHAILGASDGQWNFDGQWLPAKQLFQTNAVQWRWQSQNHNIHANGVGQNWQLSWSALMIPQLNAVMTASTNAHGTLNVSLNASNATRTNNYWAVKQFQIDGGWQDQQNQSTLSIGGQLSWPDAQTWILNNLTITSHQESLGRQPNQRFISDLSGEATGILNQGGQLKLQGQFDNQPMTLQMQYKTEHKPTSFIGVIELAQLNLRPYQQNIPTALADSWLKKWRRALKNYALDWQINIDHIITNSLQLNQLKAHLVADKNVIDLDPVSMQMYDGSSNASLHITNNETPSWQLQQRFQDIQIKPLLQDNFNFHNIDGKGDAHIFLNSQNNDGKHWFNGLNGKIDLQLHEGLLKGIDINNILQNKNNNNTMTYNEASQTTFKLLKLNIPLKNGFSHKSMVTIKADNFDIKGQGSLNISSQLMDYMILISTRHNNEQSLLPLKINGAITHPNFSIDYQRLTAGLRTPEQKQESLRQTLAQQWLWLNQGASSENNDWRLQP